MKLLRPPDLKIVVLTKTSLVEAAPEGKILQALHYFKERNKGLVKKKKDQALAKFGKLDCEGCNFNFETVYGDSGKGFIECQHLIPISSLNESSVTRLSDLALVCSNCHRVIHKAKP